MRGSRGRTPAFPWFRPGPEAAERERGSLTLMLAAMFVMLLALAGVVVDGGAKLTAAENAASVAQEAARAGAGMVTRANVYSNGSFIVDRGPAAAAAQQYLTGLGYRGRVSWPKLNTIEVTVHISKPTKVLSVIGIKWIRVKGQATATLAAGVTGPGR